jgi:hypothetical protein
MHTIREAKLKNDNKINKKYSSAPLLTFVIGVLFIILGAKLFLIARYGSQIPFWDQWDGESSALYKPYFEGNLHFLSLFDVHNEHRMLFSRILCLGLLLLEGRWDPMLQMIAGAALHVISIGVLLMVLGRELRALPLAMLAAFTAAIFSIPFDWENTLEGFHGFHFQLLFAIPAIYLTAVSRAWSPKWSGGTALAVASYFNVASGALTPVAIAAVSAAQIMIGNKRGRSEWLGITLHCALALTMIAFVPRLAHHEPLRAHSLREFASAFLMVSSWPVAPSLVIFLHAPMLVLSASVVRDRPGIGDVRWVFVCLWLWLGLQYLSLAYGRAAGVTASRYLDMLLIGLVLNFAALAHLIRDRHSYQAAVIVSTWILVVSVGCGHEAILKALPGIVARQEVNAIEIHNVRSYLTTGDVSFLTDKPLFHIPYPDPDRLRSLLDEPEIRAILPPVLSAEGRETRQAIVNTRDLFLAHPLLVAAIGIATFFFGLVRLAEPTEARHGQTAESPENIFRNTYHSRVTSSP